MPAKSEAQRKYLFWKFGEAWARRHHFANKGKLPKRARKKRKLKKGERSALKRFRKARKYR